MRPLLLDLYCGAGGASMGYHQAGFDVVGVDINPQPNYPFKFVQGDALDVALWPGADVIAASPPCQRYTSGAGQMGTRENHPDLVALTRDTLLVSGRPFVIENVIPAPLYKERSIVLCGEMFGLRTIRHRRFEPSPGLTLVAPPHPKHTRRSATKQRRQRWAEGWHMTITGDVGTYMGPEAMGIDWMTGNELSEAIPPAYTRFIGAQLIEHLS